MQCQSIEGVPTDSRYIQILDEKIIFSEIIIYWLETTYGRIEQQNHTDTK